MGDSSQMKLDHYMPPMAVPVGRYTRWYGMEKQVRQAEVRRDMETGRLVQCLLILCRDTPKSSRSWYVRDILGPVDHYEVDEAKLSTETFNEMEVLAWASSRG